MVIRTLPSGRRRADHNNARVGETEETASSAQRVIAKRFSWRTSTCRSNSTALSGQSGEILRGTAVLLRKSSRRRGVGRRVAAQRHKCDRPSDGGFTVGIGADQLGNVSTSWYSALPIRKTRRHLPSTSMERGCRGAEARLAHSSNCSPMRFSASPRNRGLRRGCGRRRRRGAAR
jgi:hypothetical protein